MIFIILRFGGNRKKIFRTLIVDTLIVLKLAKINRIINKLEIILTKLIKSKK